MNLVELQIKIEPGDARTIAGVTGYTEDYVRKTLRGDRTNDTIVKALEMLIKGRESLIEQISIMCEEEEGV